MEVIELTLDDLAKKVKGLKEAKDVVESAESEGFDLDKVIKLVDKLIELKRLEVGFKEGLQKQGIQKQQVLNGETILNYFVASLNGFKNMGLTKIDEVIEYCLKNKKEIVMMIEKGLRGGINGQQQQK